MSRGTSWHVRTVMIQTSLCTRTVWSESLIGFRLNNPSLL